MKVTGTPHISPENGKCKLNNHNNYINWIYRAASSSRWCETVGITLPPRTGRLLSDHCRGEETERERMTFFKWLMCKHTQCYFADRVSVLFQMRLCPCGLWMYGTAYKELIDTRKKRETREEAKKKTAADAAVQGKKEKTRERWSERRLIR